MHLQSLPSPLRHTGGGVTSTTLAERVLDLPNDLALEKDAASKKPARGRITAKYQQRAAGRVAVALPEKPKEAKVPPRPRLKLSELYEQRVLKTGVRCLHDRLVRKKAVELHHLPRKENGSCRLMRESFFQRLLSEEIELQGSMPNDIASAQSDLRHLNLEQLLGVRSRTLDFATESRSHDAHNNFLNTLDRHLFESICVRHLRAGTDLRTPDLMQRLGFRLALVLGARTVLQEGSQGLDSSLAGREAKPREGEEAKPVPICWALPLEDERWGPTRLALFDTEELQVDLLVGDQEKEIETAASGRPVAIVYDRSSGIGKDRMLHWEVASVDSKSGELLAELEKSKRGSLKAGSTQMAKDHAAELAAVLARRNSGESITGKPRPALLVEKEDSLPEFPRARANTEPSKNPFPFGQRRLPARATWNNVVKPKQSVPHFDLAADEPEAPVQHFDLAADDSDGEETADELEVPPAAQVMALERMESAPAKILEPPIESQALERMESAPAEILEPVVEIQVPDAECREAEPAKDDEPAGKVAAAAVAQPAKPARAPSPAMPRLPQASAHRPSAAIPLPTLRLGARGARDAIVQPPPCSQVFKAHDAPMPPLRLATGRACPVRCRAVVGMPPPRLGSFATAAPPSNAVPAGG